MIEPDRQNKEHACLHQPLSSLLEQHAANCVECNLCVKGCSFLQKYGTPRTIAASFDPNAAASLQQAFECSLCGLCTSVCPPKIGLDPQVMLLAMRREAVLRGVAPFPAHMTILGYEKRGNSDRYSFYGLPENCDTVLFPGCTFPGTRPARLLELFKHLQQSIPNLGIVLDCCSKPSHDLGRADAFQTMFTGLRDHLLGCGITKILVLCPNCYRVFDTYGAPLMVETVYSWLVDHPVATGTLQGQVTVHDPCAIRQNNTAQQAVRQLISRASLDIIEMKHNRSRTICCGEGGAAGFVNPGFADNWGAQRQQEAGTMQVITYCAGCVNFLGSRMRACHIIDLLFAPGASLADKVRVAKAPFTYLNRLILKYRFKKLLANVVSHPGKKQP